MLGKLDFRDRTELARWIQKGQEVTMSTIVKIAKCHDWDAARSTGSYKPSSFETDGFIHCSILEEVADVANYHYLGDTDLLLLYIDSERVVSEIRYETAGDDDVLWPHIYGPLNLDAVYETVDFIPDTGGRFSQPIHPTRAIETS